MTLSNPAQYISGRTVQEQMNSLIDYVDQRAADVALDAIASDVAQVHSDAADAHTDALAAAASAAAAAGTLANAVKKTGESSQSIAGNVAVAGTLSGGVVTGTVVTVPTPTNNTDAATKKYVDDADALKISITDINNYAVGLTGNQGPIAGVKTFASRINASTGGIKGTHFSGDHSGWCKVCEIADTNRAYIIDLISCSNNTKYTYARVFVLAFATPKQMIGKYVWKVSSETVNMCLTRDNDGKMEVWFNGVTTGVDFMLINIASYGAYQDDLSSKPTFYTDSGVADSAAKPTTPDYAAVVDVS